MDIEQLTKHQIVLLTLLVSFMTSIATGIVTVSLMNQAPPEVTRVINQVVQQTVEKAVSLPGTNTTIQKTIIQNDNDLVVQAVSAARQSIIRITAHGDDTLIARGVLINANGTALTDKEALNSSTATAFDAILPSGDRVPLTIAQTQVKGSPIAIVQVAVGTSTSIAPLSVADSSKLALGQGVVSISGIGSDTVGEGIIATIPSGSSHDAPTMIEANTPSAMPGSILLTLSGTLIGISTSASEAQGNDFYSLPTLLASSTATK